MHKSKLPLLDWYMAMFLMTATKKSFSAHEMQRQLGRKRYEPVFRMMHKIRSAMGQRDDCYMLGKEVELDDAFFETVRPGSKQEALKTGRGSQKQARVLVMAESVEAKNPKAHQKAYRCRFFKMKVVQNVTSLNVNSVAGKSIEPKARVVSDAFPAFNKLINKVGEHNQLVIPPKDQPKLLPWVHTAISNAKRFLLGIFHRVDRDYLQCYLDEFTYKLNRRFFTQKFDRIMDAAISTRWNQFCRG